MLQSYLLELNRIHGCRVMKRSTVPLRFAIALPAAAVAADTLISVEDLSGRSAFVTDIWYAVNAPARIVELAGWPITNAIGYNFAIDFDKTFFAIGVAVLWFAMGFAIDRWNSPSVSRISQEYGETPKRALLFTARMLTVLVLAVVEAVLLQATFTRLETGTRLLIRNNGEAFITLVTLTRGVLLLGWAILLLLGAVRYFGDCVDTMQQVIRPRPRSSWKAYIPAAMVLPLLITIDDRVLALTLLLVITVVQFQYRTVAGWIVLLIWFLHYSLLAVINTIQSRDSYTPQFFFLVCGLAPLVALLLWHPRFDTGGRVQYNQ